MQRRVVTVLGKPASLLERAIESVMSSSPSELVRISDGAVAIGGGELPRFQVPPPGAGCSFGSHDAAGWEAFLCVGQIHNFEQWFPPREVVSEVVLRRETCTYVF
eukprot:INCI16751.2.p1 GENE.INCI16751.2~~INCI16751.2.p1  ORF type:complete len:105 (-),score=16.60 INCI16751.2:364-678(-)